jgi:hypothetical protein
MTMELTNREIWANVSKYWYNQVAYHSPNVGRVQHHLAVLSHPDVLQQLFYHTKALISVRPFTDGRENFNTLLSSYNGQSLHQHSTVTALLAAHGALFCHGSTEQFITLANHFLSLLRKEISLPGRQGLQSVYMMSSNFSSVLQHGALETIIAVEFSQNQSTNATGAHADALKWAACSAVDSRRPSGGSVAAPSQIPTWITFHGCSLAFHTLAVLLDQVEDPSICPGVHISLALIWCLALHPQPCSKLSKLFPGWQSHNISTAFWIPIPYSRILKMNHSLFSTVPQSRNCLRTF